MTLLRIALLLVAVFSLSHGNYYGPEAPVTPWRGPIHVPQLRPDGVPREPPQVEAERAHHLAKLQEAYATAAPKVGLHQQQGGWTPHQNQQQWAPQHQAEQWTPHPQAQWRGPLAQLGPNGVVQETPEWQQIRNHHMQEYNRALARTAGHGHHHY